MGKYWRGTLLNSTTENDLSYDLAQSKNYNLTNQASQSFEAMISVFSCCRTRSSVMLRDMDVLTSNILQLINSQNRRTYSINIFMQN